MMPQLIAWIVTHPRTVILAVLLLTALAALGLARGIELDVSPLNFIERESAERREYESARQDFGDDKYLLVAVTTDDLFTRERMQQLRLLHEAIGRLPGITEILSLANISAARSTPAGASIGPLIPAGEISPEQLSEARAMATRDRLYLGNLVSADGRTAALNILLDNRLSTRERHELTARIYELARGSGLGETFFAGDPFAQWRATVAVKRDLALFLPITVLLIAGLLWHAFRSWIAVLLPLSTIGLGLIWIFGLMGAIGAHFTILALMLPTLLLAIGCSYLVHVINQIGLENERRNGSADPAATIEAALRFIALPVIVSALTIIAGFLSLAFTRIPAIRATALFAALGSLTTMILSLTFVPAVCALLGRRAVCFATGLDGSLVSTLTASGEIVTRRTGWLYGVTAALIIVSLIGLGRITIDIDYFNFFRPGSETSVGLEKIGERLSGAVNFDLIIEGDEPRALESPERLRQLAELQREIEASGQGIDRTLSAADFIRHLNRAFNGGDERFETIPAQQRVIDDLLVERGPVAAFLTEDGRRARVLLRARSSSARKLSTAIEDVERRAAEKLPGLRAYATGTIVLMNRTSDVIGGEQVQSVAIALLTIFLMLAVLFRSLRIGMTALLPNLIPVLFFFGFMGWGGIALNLTTSLVASVVLGLAVDNAVQFIVRFQRLQPESKSVREAIINSLRLSGRPIIYANIALAATFAIFSLSNFEPISSFGLLSAVTILGCLLEDLVLLPARLTSPVFHSKQNEKVAVRGAE